MQATLQSLAVRERQRERTVGPLPAPAVVSPAFVWVAGGMRGKGERGKSLSRAPSWPVVRRYIAHAIGPFACILVPS